MLRRTGLRWLLIVSALLVMVLALVWSARPKPIPIRLQSVDVGPVETTVANTRAGTVNACRRAKLAPPFGGQIAEMRVKEGDRVRAGQVLLVLWQDDSSAQLQAARQAVRASQPRAEQVCTLAGEARREAERSQRLLAQNVISAERHDQIQAQAASQQAACQAAQADVRQSAARLQATEAQHSRATLRAPFAGIVAEITGEQGEYTTPSPPGIATLPAVDLIDDSCLLVTAPLDEVDAPKVRPGMPVRISVDAFPDRRFAGKVKRVAPYVLDREKQARTVDVEVSFDDPASAKGLLVGYSADIEVVLLVKPAALRVPTQALQEGNTVLRLADDLLETRKLKVGLSNWQYTEVLDGLAKGDRVALSLEKDGVKAGARVVAEPAAP